MSSKQLIQELSGLPTIQITYETAIRHFGGQVAAAMEQVHSSAAKLAKELEAPEFKYHLTYRRAPDPPGVTDQKTFAKLLATQSECWLKTTGRNFIDYQPISITPDKIMAIYEQRARSICAARAAQQQPSRFSESNDEPDDGTDIDSEDSQVSPANGPLASLQDWLRTHPRHSKPLASIAKTALEALIQGE